MLTNHDQVLVKSLLRLTNTEANREKKHSYLQMLCNINKRRTDRHHAQMTRYRSWMRGRGCVGALPAPMCS